MARRYHRDQTISTSSPPGHSQDRRRRLEGRRVPCPNLTRLPSYQCRRLARTRDPETNDVQASPGTALPRDPCRAPVGGSSTRGSLRFTAFGHAPSYRRAFFRTISGTTGSRDHLPTAAPRSGWYHGRCRSGQFPSINPRRTGPHLDLIEVAHMQVPPADSGANLGPR